MKKTNNTSSNNESSSAMSAMSASTSFMPQLESYFSDLRMAAYNRNKRKSPKPYNQLADDMSVSVMSGITGEESTSTHASEEKEGEATQHPYATAAAAAAGDRNGCTAATEGAADEREQVRYRQPSKSQYQHKRPQRQHRQRPQHVPRSPGAQRRSRSLSGSVVAEMNASFASSSQDQSGDVTDDNQSQTRVRRSRSLTSNSQSVQKARSSSSAPLRRGCRKKASKSTTSQPNQTVGSPSRRSRGSSQPPPPPSSPPSALQLRLESHQGTDADTVHSDDATLMVSNTGTMALRGGSSKPRGRHVTGPRTPTSGRSRRSPGRHSAAYRAKRRTTSSNTCPKTPPSVASDVSSPIRSETSPGRKASPPASPNAEDATGNGCLQIDFGRAGQVVEMSSGQDKPRQEPRSGRSMDDADSSTRKQRSRRSKSRQRASSASSRSRLKPRRRSRSRSGRTSRTTKTNDDDDDMSSPTSVTTDMQWVRSNRRARPARETIDSASGIPKSMRATPKSAGRRKVMPQEQKEALDANLSELAHMLSPRGSKPGVGKLLSAKHSRVGVVPINEEKNKLPFIANLRLPQLPQLHVARDGRSQHD